jgi:predicted 2-oxoglutarate/Fe(II)-dependent dioxygenase YbiX
MFFDARKIRHITNFQTIETCSLLYKQAQESEKDSATVGKIINGKYTTDYNKWCTAKFVQYEHFDASVKNLIPKISDSINNFYNVTCNNNPEIHFLSYPSESYYESHVDGQYIEDGIAKRGVNRDITAVYYLNSNYEGGSVNFEYFDLSIKPKQNDLLIYPTTFQYKHSVSKVIGERYAIVFWFETYPHLNVDIKIPDAILKHLN